MYLRAGRWWVSLLPSLLQAAAKATPDVADGRRQIQAFTPIEDRSSAVSELYETAKPAGTSSRDNVVLPYDTFSSLGRGTPGPSDPRKGSFYSTSKNFNGSTFLSEWDAPTAGVFPKSGSSSVDGPLPRRYISSSSTPTQRTGAEAFTWSGNTLGESKTLSGLLSDRSGISSSNIEYGNFFTSGSSSEDNISGLTGNYLSDGDDFGIENSVTHHMISSPRSPPSVNFPVTPCSTHDFQHLASIPTSCHYPFWDFSAWRRVNARHNAVLLLTDVDDTLWSSGGWRVAGCTIGGIDKEYARGEGYPGITALYFVIAAGEHATAAADPPAQPSNLLLPSCPEPHVHPFLQVCPAAPTTYTNAGSSPSSSTTSSTAAFSLKKFGGENVSTTGEADLTPRSGSSSSPLTPKATIPSQHFPVAAAAPRSPASDETHMFSKYSSAHPTYCAAFSFSPATGIRRPNPAKCRAPLTLPPAVGLLTARLSTSFFKGWTRSPSFYHDIDWILEHGARLMYGPDVFAGAWTHGFENNVELMRDTIGGQHSRGRAKVQGFRAALEAGLRPAARVAAEFTIARLRMVAEDSGLSDAYHQPVTATSSSPLASVGPSTIRQGWGRSKGGGGSLNIDRKAARSPVTGLPNAGGAGRGGGEESAERRGVDLVAGDIFEIKSSAAMSKDSKSSGTSVESRRRVSSIEAAQAKAMAMADFAPSIDSTNPVVPVIFGDTGEKDIEVAASAAALAPDRLAAVFSHFVFADRNAEKQSASGGAKLVIPSGAVPFTFNFNGFQLRALQFTFDVVVRLGHGVPQPSSFADLNDGQLYALGQRVGIYLRTFITSHSRLYLAGLSNLDKLVRTAGAAAEQGRQRSMQQQLQAHPLLFLRFSGLYVRRGAPRQPLNLLSGFSGLFSRVRSHFKRKVWKLATYTSEEDQPDVEVIPISPILKSTHPEEWDHGVPIVPYRTTISAATSALLLQMITLQDLVNVVIASVRDLRSLGRPGACANAEQLKDHLFDIVVVVDLLGDFLRPDVVQHYETYTDAVAAVRTFYEATRFCQTLSDNEIKSQGGASAAQDASANSFYVDSELAHNFSAVFFPWEELQHSPAFEACFTAFAPTVQPTGAENSSEYNFDAQRQSDSSRFLRRTRKALQSAAEQIERHTPGLLTVARVACAYLPQLQHWRSAGGAELEALSAEWFVALTQAATSRDTKITDQANRANSVHSYRARPGAGPVAGANCANSGWRRGGDCHPKRHSSPAGLAAVEASYESSASTSNMRLGRDLQRRTRSSEKEGVSWEETLRSPLYVADNSTGEHIGAAVDSSPGTPRQQDRLTASTASAALASNAAVYQRTMRNAFPVETSVLRSVSMPASTLAGTSSPIGDYRQQVVEGSVVAALQQGRENTRLQRNAHPKITKHFSFAKTSTDSLSARTIIDARRRSSAGELSGFLTGANLLTFDALHKRPVRSRNGDSPADPDNRIDSRPLDNGVACPTLAIHRLIRITRPICETQRQRFGDNAPCAILSRVLYDDKLLSTFNAIQIWIKSGSSDPLYLENLGLTLDPPRPTGGKQRLSKIESTVVEKTGGRERYKIQRARAQHKQYLSLLPFFVDPACNPFS